MEIGLPILEKIFKGFLPYMDPANPLYCILIWYIDITYVSGKPGPGGTYLKIENGDDPIF